MKIMNRGELLTERQNELSHGIDRKSISEILKIINNQDRILADRVAATLPAIKLTVEFAVEALKKGGRIIYVGAGTSGRLGVLDASEIPPTFSAPSLWFQGVIAGGGEALTRSIEGAEDHPEDGIRDMKRVNLTGNDLVIGIASSGTTPYVISALEYAGSLEAKTCFLICNPKLLIPVKIDVLINVDVGSEIVTGSTRMKSGTVTKMVLNMISTTTMIRLGKTYSNLMVDLMAVNDKLIDRGTRIIRQLTDLNYDEAKEYLLKADGSVKIAIVMARVNCDIKKAQKLIKEKNGFLRGVIGDINQSIDSKKIKLEKDNDE